MMQPDSALTCLGCLIPSDGTQVDLRDGDTIAIEWRVKHSKFTPSLSLAQVFSAAQEHESVQKVADSSDAPISLNDVLREYEKPEWMAESDFHCPKCKCAREGIKRETIWRFPDILLIQLKRFAYTSYGCVKNDASVTAPAQEFNVAPYCTANAEGSERSLMELLPLLKRDNSHLPLPSPNTSAPSNMYDLQSFIVHRGSFHDGHYWTVARNESNDWYEFNDHQCTKVDMASPKNATEGAYMLVYQRRDMPEVKSWARQLESTMAELERATNAPPMAPSQQL
jgi:ubiquitin C-terminal hydrolase